jgi:hypothetical protein
VAPGQVERVPTIVEMLDYAVTTDMQVYLDTKCSGVCIDTLCGILNTYPEDLTGRVTVGAWTETDVARIAANAPRFRRSIIKSTLPRDPTAVDVRNFNLNFGAVKVDPSFVARAHANNQTVYGWTINAASEMEAALAIPVDGIVTDYPDVAKELRDNVQGKAGAR